MEGFTPAAGDVIKGMNGYCSYQNGQWQGSLTELVPGVGYMYYSVSGQTKSFVFGGSEVDPSVLPDAALEGEFTVDASGTKVRFSPGNLQCRVDPDQEGEAIAGAGTELSNIMPYNTYYRYSICQMLFKQWELHEAGLTAGPITGIAFESNSSNHFLRTGIEIWISATTLTEVPTTSVSTSGMTRVFTGMATQQTGWTPLDFGTAFNWNGTSNLLVTVVMNHGSFTSSTSWKCSNLEFNGAGYKCNDGTPYYPSTNTYPLTTATMRPNVRFTGRGGVLWRFAKNQRDYIGMRNESAIRNFDGWFDLFPWGTSGHPHGAEHWQPWSSTEDVYGYDAYGLPEANLYDQTGEADWGCNPISNGGNQPFQWRTLSHEEWEYLLETRSTPSGMRFAKACVGGTNGMILLPDDWSTAYYSLYDANDGNESYGSNVITAVQWSTLEQHGAVFLPITSFLQAGDVAVNDEWAFYWTASSDYFGLAVAFEFCDNYYSHNVESKGYGLSVRLVCQTNPHIRTVGLTNATDRSCTVNGEVQATGLTVSERGFCWNTTGGPTVSDSKISMGTGAGAFSGQLTGLTPGTTYHVKAYAKIGSDYRYGNELCFTTEAAVDDGTTTSVFSVSASTKVQFSKGNLQYCATTDTWRFAEHQWDYLGSNNASASSTYTGWIDLFGWGTSGYSHGAISYQPWSKTTTMSEYYAYGNGSYNLFDQTGKADWGYNAISNGGGQTNQWRTLTHEEWAYLFNTRSTSSGIRYAKAKVNNINGVILLPDNWASSYYNLNSTNSSSASYSANTISSTQWTTLEQHGAVFLPAAGYRSESSYYQANTTGNYWSASSRYAERAWYVWFLDSDIDTEYSSDKSCGQSVRLVRDAH